jgi:hypothetical protein
MKQIEFIKFLESIEIKKDNGSALIKYVYKEQQKEHIITQSIYFRGSGVVSLILTIVNRQLIEKNDILKLSDKNIKENIIEIILDFYDKHGVVTKNMMPFVREKKISEILG